MLHAAHAVTRMQARVDRLIAERRDALAVVSHDLRRPVARLRLRAGFIEDPGTARAIDADLDGMEPPANPARFMEPDELFVEVWEHYERTHAHASSGQGE